jgi:hypothetical protein
MRVFLRRVGYKCLKDLDSFFYMQKGREVCSIDDISNDYEILLFDTSAFISCYDKHNSGVAEENLKNLDIEQKCLNSLKQLMIATGRIYIIPGVRDEARGLDYLCSSFSQGFERRFHRELRKDCRKRHCLIKMIEERGNLIDLNGGKEFERLRDHYEYLKRIGYGPRKQKISEVDLRVLLTGLYNVLNGKNTAIFSNDHPMMFSWQKVLVAEYLYSQQLGFFFRDDIERYSKAIPRSSEQLIRTSTPIALHGH